MFHWVFNVLDRVYRRAHETERLAIDFMLIASCCTGYFRFISDQSHWQSVECSVQDGSENECSAFSWFSEYIGYVDIFACIIIQFIFIYYALLFARISGFVSAHYGNTHSLTANPIAPVWLSNWGEWIDRAAYDMGVSALYLRIHRTIHWLLQNAIITYWPRPNQMRTISPVSFPVT